jgi:hypothetical protein
MVLYLFVVFLGVSPLILTHLTSSSSYLPLLLSLFLLFCHVVYLFVDAILIVAFVGWVRSALPLVFSGAPVSFASSIFVCNSRCADVISASLLFFFLV